MYTDTRAEFTGRGGETAEATAERFARLWAGDRPELARVKWVDRAGMFQLPGCRSTFRVVLDGEFYSVHEVKGHRE